MDEEITPISPLPPPSPSPPFTLQFITPPPPPLLSLAREHIALEITPLPSSSSPPSEWRYLWNLYVEDFTAIWLSFKDVVLLKNEKNVAKLFTSVGYFVLCSALYFSHKLRFFSRHSLIAQAQACLIFYTYSYFLLESSTGRSSVRFQRGFRFSPKVKKVIDVAFLFIGMFFEEFFDKSMNSLYFLFTIAILVLVQLVIKRPATDFGVFSFVMGVFGSVAHNQFGRITQLPLWVIISIPGLFCLKIMWLDHYWLEKYHQPGPGQDIEDPGQLKRFQDYEDMILLFCVLIMGLLGSVVNSLNLMDKMVPNEALIITLFGLFSLRELVYLRRVAWFYRWSIEKSKNVLSICFDYPGFSILGPRQAKLVAVLCLVKDLAIQTQVNEGSSSHVNLVLLYNLISGMNFLILLFPAGDRNFSILSINRIFDYRGQNKCCCSEEGPRLVRCGVDSGMINLTVVIYLPILIGTLSAGLFASLLLFLRDFLFPVLHRYFSVLSVILRSVAFQCEIYMLVPPRMYLGSPHVMYGAR